jgi:hypothetical protein
MSCYLLYLVNIFSPPASLLPSLLTPFSVLLYNTSTFELVEKLNKGLTCVNAVGFHPFSALLVSTSGERQFDYVGEDSGTDSDTDSEVCESDGDRKRQDGVAVTAVDSGDSVCSSSGSSTHTSAVERQVQGQEQGEGHGPGRTSRDERDSVTGRRNKKCKPSPTVRVPPPPSGVQVWSVCRTPIILPDAEVVPIKAVTEVVAVISEAPVDETANERAVGGGEEAGGGEAGGGEVGGEEAGGEEAGGGEAG